MIVNKILVDNSYQPDLSGIDQMKYIILGFSLNDDCESYTVNVEEIVNEKKESYRKEMRDLLEQHTRLTILEEFDRLEVIEEEIRQKTIEIRNRFPNEN